ncbi:MAG: SocA family protein [Tannerellaceae bacterium]|nr:SocA family protein [Tannerellaceae bacterium]
MLKLIYLIEEVSVKKNKLPFFGIPFEVWQAGPVAKDVFVDLDVEPVIFDRYISICRENKATYVFAKSAFDNGEFSDNDIEVMNYVIEKYGNNTARQLVGIVHKKGSAWYHVAEKNGLLEAFREKLTNSSNIEIDFTYYLTGCDAEKYRDCIDFHRCISHLSP